MKLLVIDTETTGLPPRGQKPSHANKSYWPYIVQFSFLEYDTDTNEFKVCDFIIKLPDKIIIPDECIKIHGITNEKMLKEGISIKHALTKFLKLFTVCDMIIGHNIEFDINMIKVELLRNNYNDLFKLYKKVEYCTMKNTTKLCNLNVKSKTNGDKYVKWPKLSELHKILFKKEPTNLHNSLVDVYACFRCYYKLRYGDDYYENNEDEFNKYKLICGV